MDHEAATSTATNKSPVEQQTTTGRQLIMDHEAATSTATNKSPVEQQTTTGRQLIMDHETATSTAASASAAEDGDEDAEHEAATDSKERLLAGALKHVVGHPALSIYNTCRSQFLLMHLTRPDLSPCCRKHRAGQLEPWNLQHGKTACRLLLWVC